MRPRIPSVAFGNLQLAADLELGSTFLASSNVICRCRIFDLLGSLDHGLHREGADLAGLLVQFGAQVFLGLVILARSHHDGVFHRADDNLRIDAFFSAEGVNRVVKLACHKIQLLVGSFSTLVVASRCVTAFTTNYPLVPTAQLLLNLRHQVGLFYVGQFDFQLLSAAALFLARLLLRASLISSVNRPSLKLSSRPSK